ncbi:hypothetical protein [uncultured Kiloniella sp.]|uniref:hypothetical protein n=1 Tax=Kiloniella sp. TaxID=1938587 RepID=UPI00260C587A|nr:hypothetical protein [uncultured Kiloniella sp.]
MSEDKTKKYETVENSEEIHKQRKRRNWAILGVLLGFIALVYAVTIVKMGMK